MCGFLLVSFACLFSLVLYELYHSSGHSVQFFHRDGYGCKGCPVILALLCRTFTLRLCCGICMLTFFPLLLFSSLRFCLGRGFFHEYASHIL